MQLRIHGVRGSSPTTGPAFGRYGGHTTCLELVLGDGHHLIIDGGTGLLGLQALHSKAGAPGPFEATVFFTHFHWDHIQGLPFFAPLYQPDTRLRLFAIPPSGYTVQSALDSAIRPPWFPVRFADAPALMDFEPLTERPVRVGEVEVVGRALHHPGGVTGYRITVGDRALVIATDVEAGDPGGDAALLALADGADVLIHDAQYTPLEWATTRSGWGHSTWEHATAVAASAGVRRLLLTSHDITRDDEGVDDIQSMARERFPATEAAFQGQVVEF